MTQLHLAPPPQSGKDPQQDRWLFLMWRQLNLSSPDSDQVIEGGQIFAPRQVVQHTEVTASDATTILAGQIFGS